MRLSAAVTRLSPKFCLPLKRSMADAERQPMCPPEPTMPHGLVFMFNRSTPVLSGRASNPSTNRYCSNAVLIGSKSSSFSQFDIALKLAVLPSVSASARWRGGLEIRQAAPPRRVPRIDIGYFRSIILRVTDSDPIWIRYRYIPEAASLPVALRVSQVTEYRPGPDPR